MKNQMFICEELAINNIWCCFCWWCRSRYIFFFHWSQSLLLILLFRRNLSREAEKWEKVKLRHQQQTVTRQRMEPWPPNRNYIKENLALNFLFVSLHYALFNYHPIKVEYNWKCFYTTLTLSNIYTSINSRSSLKTLIFIINISLSRILFHLLNVTFRPPFSSLPVLRNISYFFVTCSA